MDTESAATFLQLLQGTQEADNAVRKRAEDLYNGLYEYHTEVSFYLLTNAIRNAPVEAIRE